jgi:predicted glycoside hydrolase/deacetylase ChbG (UPF0249 family)
VRRLIVNGDDFGASDGVNRGVIDAHRTGILTSASLMVDGVAAAAAARLARDCPRLGLGLHVVAAPGAGDASLHAELERQLERFVTLTGRSPTHVDSHHDIHRDAQVLPGFVAFAARHRLPLRGFCGVRQITHFYGQCGGETRLEQIAPEVLIAILATEIDEGFTELCCHPGYVDPGLRSSYTVERQAELDALRDDRLPAVLREREIALATYGDLAQP